METTEDLTKVELITKVLKSHFGHSSVDSDIEDAAWSILNTLEQ